MSLVTRTVLVALACSLTATAPIASAQDRSRSGRSRMELAFDHGYGASSEGGYAEIAADLRIYAPFGLGAVLRTGIASNLFSNALAADLGVAYRLDLVAEEHVGLQLAGAIGPSIAYDPFDQGNVTAFGGWAMVHLDFWHRNVFVGLGASAHALLGERHAEVEGRGAPILTLAPMSASRRWASWGRTAARSCAARRSPPTTPPRAARSSSRAASACRSAAAPRPRSAPRWASSSAPPRDHTHAAPDLPEVPRVSEERHRAPASAPDSGLRNVRAAERVRPGRGGRGRRRRVRLTLGVPQSASVGSSARRAIVAS